MSFRSAVAARSAVPGLEDLSLLHRGLRVQGDRGPALLTANGLPCPDELFAVHRLATAGEKVIIARVGQGDVVLKAGAEDPAMEGVESPVLAGAESAVLAGIEVELRTAPGVFTTTEHSATLRLSGAEAERVWRQTCGVAIAEAPADRVVYTRVAGVSCAVIPEAHGAERVYRIWVDYSLATALWDCFAEILSE